VSDPLEKRLEEIGRKNTFYASGAEGEKLAAYARDDVTWLLGLIDEWSERERERCAFGRA
jgi:hypothetical protein